MHCIKYISEHNEMDNVNTAAVSLQYSVVKWS